MGKNDPVHLPSMEMNVVLFLRVSGNGGSLLIKVILIVAAYSLPKKLIVVRFILFSRTDTYKL